MNRYMLKNVMNVQSLAYKNTDNFSITLNDIYYILQQSPWPLMSQSVQNGPMRPQSSVELGKGCLLIPLVKVPQECNIKCTNISFFYLFIF
jgi:hypothetical protein